MVLSHAVGLGLSCGGVSGIMSRAVVHPFDTLRVLQSVSSTAAAAEVVAESSAQVGIMQRLSTASMHWKQTAQRAIKDGNVAVKTAYHNWHLGPTQSNPLYDLTKLRQSVRILYRGYALSVLGAQPVYAIYFGAYEAAKLKMTELNPERSSTLIQISAGFLAECCAVTVWNPWEVVRQRMQLGGATGGPARTFVQTTQDVVRESGVRGLYAGVGGYLALWGTFSPLMFVLYEQGMSLVYPKPLPGMQPRRGSGVPSFGVSFAMGGLAGFVAAAITSPFDVVKTRMQTQTPTTMLRYTNVFHGLQEIYTNEGWRALFRGTVARSLNQGLAAGIMLGCYGTLRAQAAQKLGYIPYGGSSDGDGGWAADGTERAQAPRLQTFATGAAPLTSAYDEGTWPADLPPVPAPPTASTDPPKRKTQGWIQPLTRWD